MKARVLVTDGDERAALAITRSLGGRGYDVHVVSSEGRSIAGASRFAASDLRLSSPLHVPEKFASELAQRCRALEPDVLLPVSEAALGAVLGARESLGDVRVPFPTLDAFRAASDKARVWEVAQQVGLYVPAQWVLTKRTQVERVPLQAAALVLKPSRSVSGGRKWSVSYASSREKLEAGVERLPQEAFPLLVQERIEGEGAGVFLLRWGGRTLAAFAHRRLREKPPSGGVSVLRESAPLDLELQHKAEELLDALGWSGVAMVEFKKERETGRLAVMEINPRFWGSLQLAIDSGVDFPRLLVEVALNETKCERPPQYEVGVRTRWELGDLDHLLLRLRHSPAQLALPPGAPGRWRALAGFLRSCLPPTRQEVFRLSDPRPFGREVVQWLAQLR